jgi:hypothetical protein
VLTQSNPDSTRRPRWLLLLAPLAAALTAILLLHATVGPADSRSRASRTRATARSTPQGAVLVVERRHFSSALFEPGAVGLSIEAKELATKDLSVDHTSLVSLMRLLGPGVLRIGGLSLDDSWWTSSDEPAPAWAKTVVTPADLVRLRGLLEATGWQTILGVDFGHFEPPRATNEAQVAEHILGSRLLSFEIGNEPNDYGTRRIGLRPGSYNAGNYLEELAAYGTAMRAAVPKIRLYGPDLGRVSLQAWLVPIASAKSTPLASIDIHYYPTHYSTSSALCKGTPVPTALELLSPEVREEENAVLNTLVGAGELAHRETRLSETNDTSSCDLPGGPATSPVFASALWALDWALRVASAGVVGINFNGYFGYCKPEASAPICEPASSPAVPGQVMARPEYYGLLAARQLEGGRFVPIRLSAPRPLPNLTTWATIAPGGTIRIAIDNLAAEGSAQRISIPLSGYTATYDRLAGPSVEATTGVTFGGVGVTSAGRWRPKRLTLSREGGSFRVVVRPASAMIVTLHPKRSQSH